MQILKEAQLANSRAGGRKKADHFCACQNVQFNIFFHGEKKQEVTLRMQSEALILILPRILPKFIA